MTDASIAAAVAASAAASAAAVAANAPSNYANDRPPVGPPPYVMPGNPTGAPPFPTAWPPPIQALARAYLMPLMHPTPVATRLPQPGRTEDTVSGFLRVEAAGGALMADGIMFNCGILLHSYAPNNEESLAEITLMKALAHGGNAMGRFIVHPSLQRPWYVAYSRVNGLGVRQADPLVNLVRFRGLLTWRVPGSCDPLNEPDDAPQ